MDKVNQELAAIAAEMDEKCTRCKACVFRCAYLQENGTPGENASQVVSKPSEQWPDGYECSLCGLCGAVCPEGLKPDALFLAMRRVRESEGGLDLGVYKSILKFEGRGNSDKYSFLHLPTGGDTILFPGCGTSANRPRTVRRLFSTLQKEIPDLGIGLGCCLKPSHDLGRVAFFEEEFGRMRNEFRQAGVKRIVTTCPNCQKVFETQGEEFEVVTAYTLLDGFGCQPAKVDGSSAIVHDPCPQRYDEATQDAVRSLAKKAKMVLLSSPEERTMTRCCGEGGMVSNVRPDLAKNWTQQRREMAAGHKIVTSCSGCVNYLNGKGRTDHILDIFFDSRPKVRRIGPLGSLARLNLKKWFRRRFG